MGEGIWGELKRLILRPQKPFLDWDTSATREWRPEEMKMLKEENPVVIADLMLSTQDPYVWKVMVTEYFAHADFKKAATIVRAMVEEDPDSEKIFRSVYQKDNQVLRILFDENLMTLTSTPEELKEKKEHRKRR